MQTLFGLPIFGSLFTPILITLVSVLLYRTFFSISKKDISDDGINIPPVQVKDLSIKVTNRVNQKKKKSCSGKKGGKDCCSSKNGIIDSTTIFVESSPCTQELSRSLMDLWHSEKLNIGIVPLHSDDLEAQLRKEMAGVSLCVFLLDNNEEKPALRPWLKSSMKVVPFNGELLTGLKYSVFIANGNSRDIIHLETDRALHRLGGVRVFKAGISDFSAWLNLLLNTVKKWNQGGKKGCKCGPDSTSENQEEHSSSSGSCSSSEDEIASTPILDLEDLGKTLS